MSSDNKSARAFELQAARVSESMANHRERIEWLSEPDPRWRDGTPVDSATRAKLFRQSQAVLSGEEPA
jgi:hypothetical protein